MKRKLKPGVKIILIIILIIAGIYYYGRCLEVKLLNINEYNITNSKIPDSFYGFKIVQVSDIYYKNTTDLNDLNNLVEKINKIKPDIVIFTGDIIDKNINYTDEDISNLNTILKNINCNIGKYIIKGDNDTNYWNDIINDTDFIDLNDKYELIYNESSTPILLLGISSNYEKNHIKKTFNELKENINEEYFTILALHEPDVIDKIDYSNIDLILAAHSLGGEINIPFIGGIINNKYAKKYKNSYYKLDNTMLYVSNGIGTNSHKFRFNNTPSINLFRLRNK